jgi:4'-phosphopantetheinyl transferase EntD
MPLFYQHNINEHTRLGVWRIAEPESFFLPAVPLQHNVSHPHKRLQHLAGRFLLRALFADFPLEEILIADTRKPFLPDEQYHFSISHCADYAAAIVSSSQRVGIDVEITRPTVEKVRHKFLSDGEHDLAFRSHSPETSHLQSLTLLWSAKEAVFKWYSLGRVDFRENIRLTGPPRKTGEGMWRLPFVFSKTDPVPLVVDGRTWGDLVMSYVVSGK